MYTVAIVDDDPRQCDILSELVRASPLASLFEIACFTSVDSLVHHQEAHGPADICVMGVEAGHGGGVCSLTAFKRSPRCIREAPLRR